MARNTSDVIENYLKQLLQQSAHRTVEVQRSQLAERFACVPSQINYVIGTRFTLLRGYVVESKRGGGGYVRIRQLELPEQSEQVFALLQHIGEQLSQTNSDAILARLLDHRWIDPTTHAVCQSMLERDTLLLPLPQRDEVRARLMKAVITTLLRTKAFVHPIVASRNTPTTRRKKNRGDFHDL